MICGPVVMDGPRSNGLPSFGYCRMCGLFLYVILAFDCFLSIALHCVCN